MRELEQLETDGYTVFKHFLDTETTARIRAHMDSLLSPVGDTGPGAHILRHPIPGDLMADILNRPKLLDLAQKIISAQDMRLLEQVLIRTDGPFPADKGGANGWHVDMAFRPEHYEATPRQIYYHMVHALNTVPPGGGAFTILPGSHRQTFAYTANAKNEADMQRLKQSPFEVLDVDLSGAVEVLAEDGDLIVFNPMCLHSASNNTTTTPRYVYFASFFDASAQYMQDCFNSQGYRDNFPDSLRDRLPSELKTLLTV